MMKDNSNPLPSLLRHYRLKMGLTQKEVADAISISRSGYANYEEGRCIPSIEQTMALSNLLNHDLLFAYTVSAQYARHNTRKKSQSNALHEDNTYAPDMSIHIKSTDFIKAFEQLDTEEQELIKLFIEKRI